MLRGVLERYSDAIASDGSVADVRFAAASRLSRRIAIGAGLHLLAGSTRMTAERRVGDSTVSRVPQSAEGRHDGVGGSGGVLIRAAPGPAIARGGRRGHP